MNCVELLARRAFARTAASSADAARAVDRRSREEVAAKKRTVAFAVVGYPNSGKSTLVNSFVRSKLCAVSKRAHTTRAAQRVLLANDDVNILVFDTPGIVSVSAKRKFNFDKSFDVSQWKPLANVDVVGLVVDASCRFTGKFLGRDAASLLRGIPDESDKILILNKVDLIPNKRALLKIADSFANERSNSEELRSNSECELRLPTFSRIFMVSALHDDGVRDILNYVSRVDAARNTSADAFENLERTPQALVVERVRAAYLERAPKEVPYQFQYEVDFLDENVFGEIYASVIVRTHKKSHVKIISNQKYVNELVRECQDDLAAAFKKPVVLKITPLLRFKP